MAQMQPVDPKPNLKTRFDAVITATRGQVI